MLLLYMPMLSLVVRLRVVGLLFVVNTGAVVLGQARRVLRLVSCVVFALSADLPGWATVAVLLAAAGIQVVGEMPHGTGSWAIGFGLAPADKQGQYQDFYGSGTAAARTVRPAVADHVGARWMSGGLAGWCSAGCSSRPRWRWRRRCGGPSDTGPFRRCRLNKLAWRGEAR